MHCDLMHYEIPSRTVMQTQMSGDLDGRRLTEPQEPFELQILCPLFVTLDLEGRVLSRLGEVSMNLACTGVFACHVANYKSCH